MTCKSNDPVKIFTVRGTSFEAANASGGGAVSENGKSIKCSELRGTTCYERGWWLSDQ